ncbi:hypothetical protein CU669_16125 [Paramagnetospirillum kuznetsovii]|uniref:Uncharacterized protein n=1 Tax=Paramagnetospirillum kuznetsovii TaxID=2053833 RepID=A0A364NUX2_9PROT|nr:hypothetical protein [Paramagnetospirillum kuznetsovii]RAU20800.1 hypothetical protein CU669_16125 [Paramagnetospirillum kuznetsovii]
MPTAAVLAAVATGWIYDEVAESVQPRMLAWVDDWLTGSDQSSIMLWLPLANWLKGVGCYDAEIHLCRQALSIEGDLIPVQLRLAEALIRMGTTPKPRPCCAG